MYAEAEVQLSVGPYKPSAISVSLKYAAHSDTLAAFFKAVEGGYLH